jgi:AcrR family transcriptional regulator
VYERFHERYAHRVGRDEQILDAAERLFYDKSFDGVGVDEIGRRAGVTGSAIYRHFRGKDDILVGLFDRANEAILERIAPPKDDPADEVFALVEAHLDFVTTHHRLAAIWMRERRTLRGSRWRTFHRKQERYLARWMDALRARYPDRDEDALTAALRGVQALLGAESPRTSENRRGTARHVLARMAHNALAALDEPDAPRAAHG